MGDKTSIEWTDASWTPIRARYWEIQNDGSGKERTGWHCERVSDGCRNCYAEGMNLRLGTGHEFKPGNLYRQEKVGYCNGESKMFLDEKMLLQPMRWGRPRKIFVCSMTDLFASFVPDAMIDRMFAIMALCPQHTFQILTKRPERMREYIDQCAVLLGRQTEIREAIVSIAGRRDASGVTEAWLRVSGSIDQGWNPLPNVWLGTSVEDQENADTRVPELLATSAHIRFLSCEPLLGPLDLTRIALPEGLQVSGFASIDTLAARGKFGRRGRLLHQVIVGGESGRRARPMHPSWARSLRDQCAAAGTAFHFKQWGEWAPGEVAADHLDPEKYYTGKSYFNDKWHDQDSPPDGHVDDEPDVYRVGKGKAGRTLDGATHDGFPA